MRQATIIGAILLAYWGCWDTTWALDDGHNITANAGVHQGPVEALETSHARRPLPAIAFSLCWAIGDGDPWPFKLWNLALHMLTAVGMYQLLVALRAHRDVAFMGVLLWAVHPLPASAVLYAVQSMALMAACGVVWACWAFVRWR